MYRISTWEGVKSNLKHYRRRVPEKTVLYQLVYQLRDELPRVWAERFQSEYGVLRDEVLKTFDEYLNCGLLCHGAARVYCDTCKHSLLVAFSCKKRGICPSCMAKRAVKFAEHLYDNVLLEVPHRHIIFTIPKRLRIYFRYDRGLSSILFDAAWGSLLEVLGKYGIPALVLTLQTAGEALNFHPHLHGCLANGLFSKDVTFKEFKNIDQLKLTQRFEERVLAALHSRELISDDVVAQILSQDHTGFSVWLGDPFQDPDSERFVARYIERGPISLEKLSIQDDIVTYTSKDGHAHEFDGLEFLALLSSHIAKPYESITRYYGFYSCRSRGERKKLAPAVEPGKLPEPKTKASSYEFKEVVMVTRGCISVSASYVLSGVEKNCDFLSSLSRHCHMESDIGCHVIHHFADVNNMVWKLQT
ncbi:MAG: hypothetical protein DCC75_10480 [Proteobacteria bacterium]|nr:MAG: hypothetical protein DCC75_10480 [Pseudomonadota bacterium]